MNPNDSDTTEMSEIDNSEINISNFRRLMNIPNTISVHPNILFCDSNEVLQKEYECPICYNDIALNMMDTTHCQHTFCHSCIFRHLETNNSCPLCRKSILSIDVRHTDNYDDYQRKINRHQQN